LGFNFLRSNFKPMFFKLDNSELNISNGYNNLKNSNNLSLISKVNSELTKTKLFIIKNVFSKYILGACHENFEIILRQYLLNRFGYISLNKSLLESKSNYKNKISYPLPRDWQNLLIKNGFKVSKYKSDFKWFLICFINLNNGLIFLFKKTTLNLFKKRVKYDFKKSIFFLGLNKNNFPKNLSDNRDIFSWYIKYFNIENFNLYHDKNGQIFLKSINNNIIYKELIPTITSIITLIQIIIWGLNSYFFSLLGLLFGNWQHSILFKELVISKFFNKADKEKISNKYMFNNSNWIYRPCWTYEAQKKGAEIILYFYSTNIKGLKLKDETPYIGIGYESMNWPCYYVWDIYQQNFISSVTANNSNSIIVGPIAFVDSSEFIYNSNNISIAVFDILPMRNEKYTSLGLEIEYYIPKITNKFLFDISEVTKKYNITILWKIKRDITNDIHPDSLKFIDDFSLMKNVKRIDANISASRVIQKVDAVISIPYTSTAIEAINSGIPSIYYDPSGLLENDKNYTHGLPLLNSLSDLDEWVCKLIKNNKSKN
jgi:polysaccharide biosynthesis PFTS motif protein